MPEQKNMKKNFFYCTAHELTQDGFLVWLFENYQEPSLQKLVKNLLIEFCALKPSEEITKIETWKQWENIDIVVYIATTERQVALFIEDKLFSNLHNNQLNQYDDKIFSHFAENCIILNKHGCDYKKFEIYRVFYKSSKLTEIDIDALQKANDNLDNNYQHLESGRFCRHWQIFDIDKIYAIFSHTVATHPLVTEYVEYIQYIYNAYQNPISSCKDTALDDIAWRGLLYSIGQKFASQFGLHFFVNKSKFAYVYLQIMKTDFTESTQNLPYLEIRSTDFKDNSFYIRLLTYGVENEMIKLYKAALAENKAFTTLMHYTPQNTKELAISKQKILLEELDKALPSYAQNYLDTVKEYPLETTILERA